MLYRPLRDQVLARRGASDEGFVGANDPLPYGQGKSPPPEIIAVEDGTRNRNRKLGGKKPAEARAIDRSGIVRPTLLSAAKEAALLALRQELIGALTEYMSG